MTTVNDLVKKGVRLSYSVNCTMPEIPDVQDVLYALRLSEQQKYYDICWANHPPYVSNVHLVAAAVDLNVREPSFNESQARTVIAQAILALFPEHDRCYKNFAYLELMKQAGQMPTEDELQRQFHTCRCSRCKDDDTLRYNPFKSLDE